MVFFVGPWGNRWLLRRLAEHCSHLCRTATVHPSHTGYQIVIHCPNSTLYVTKVKGLIPHPYGSWAWYMKFLLTFSWTLILTNIMYTSNKNYKIFFRCMRTAWRNSTNTPMWKYYNIWPGPITGNTRNMRWRVCWNQIPQPYRLDFIANCTSNSTLSPQWFSNTL